MILLLISLPWCSSTSIVSIGHTILLLLLSFAVKTICHRKFLNSNRILYPHFDFGQCTGTNQGNCWYSQPNTRTPMSHFSIFYTPLPNNCHAPTMCRCCLNTFHWRWRTERCVCPNAQHLVLVCSSALSNFYQRTSILGSVYPHLLSAQLFVQGLVVWLWFRGRLYAATFYSLFLLRLRRVC